ncbi:MAG TPA: SPFH domain-containing protein [Candidatus Woesearchaeota archaeon]|nr:SPFH domain-containing protein [Candidatus Woesearchaeota archaeon]
MSSLLIILIVLAVVLFFSGIKIVRPVEKGVVERLGKVISVRDQGFNWIIPVFDKMIKVNITERMVDVEPQTVITRDKLNAIVDAVVYYKIIDVKKAIYNVDDHESQLVSLARTTLRAVVGKMTLTEANENRDEINLKVESILDKETDSYGVEVLRVEIQKIEPPKDVQEAMNMVVKAEQEKIAALDIASATETKADGERRASIKKAEGIKQAKILEAQGEAQYIMLVNESAEKYFKGNAQILKKLEVVENSLRDNAKIVLPDGKELVNVIGDLAGVTPIKTGREKRA